MKKTKRILFLLACALAGAGALAQSHAGEPANGWIVSGPSQFGGNYIIGLPGSDVGQLGVGTVPVSLSPNGGDYVILDPGATASGINTATILFESSNNTLINYGTINAPVEDTINTFQNTGVGFLSGTGLYNETVINHGLITGGDGSGFEVCDAGVALVSLHGIYNTNIINSGFITAGSSGTGGGGFFSSIGTGVLLFDRNPIPDINGAALNNAGTIIGGSNVSDSLITGNGVTFLSFGNVLNIVLNNADTGLIQGGNNDATGFVIGSGVAFVAAPTGTDALSNVTVTNAGQILGGSNADHTNAEFPGNLSISGAGLALWGGNGVYNATITNTGIIKGGSSDFPVEIVGNSVFDSGFGSISNSAIAIFDANGNVERPGDISNVSIMNSGLIEGGNNGSYAFIVNTGVGVVGEGNVSGVSVTNTVTGVITGGNGGEGSDEIFGGTALVGDGIGIASDVESGGYVMSNIKIDNSGIIVGGGNNFDGEVVGTGVGIWGGNGVYGALVTNSGVIIGGNNNEDSYLLGVGVGIVDANFEDKDINGVGIINSGLIVGGNNNFDAFGAGEGIAVLGESNVNNVAINNMGTVIGGNNTNGEFEGEGIAVGSFGDTSSNILIVNSGTVLGGGGGSSNSNGNEGVLYVAEGSGGNRVITNYGLIQGGNASAGGFAGAGVGVFADNTVVSNWGVIAAGTGKANAEIPGFPAIAIQVEGNNNVINLNGHSSVFGTIETSGANNLLNLNFTGLSAQATASLDQQLAAQGYVPGQPFTGVFTVRGVTYYVDPLMIGLNPSSYQAQGITANQKSVGANLDSFTKTPPPAALAVLNAIDASGNVPHALDELSPQRYQIYGDIALANANFNTLEIDHRLNNLRDGSESIDTMGVGGDTDKTASGLSKDDGKESKEIVSTAAPEKRWGFFASGNAIFTSIDARDGISSSGFTTSGIMLGVDGKVKENWIVGTFFNYEHTEADLDAQGSSAKVDSYGGGLYAGYHDGGWYGNGLASYNHNNYDSTRTIIFPGVDQFANGSTNGDQFEVNVDGGYDFHVSPKITVGPIAGLQYVHLNVDGFSENGAPGSDLSVGSQSLDSFRSRLGFRADYHTQIAKEVAFGTEIRAEWQHEFLDDSRDIDAAFIGSGLGAFGVQTSSPERDAALVGVGVNFTVRDRATLFFDYDVQAGQQSYIEHSVKGGLRFSF